MRPCWATRAHGSASGSCTGRGYNFSGVLHCFGVPKMGVSHPAQGMRDIHKQENEVEQKDTITQDQPAPAWINQLHQVDASDFVRELPPNSIDMLLTDPPYCSGGLHIGARSKAPGSKYINASTRESYAEFDFDNMDQRSWQFWCQGWLGGAFRALKPGGLVVCFIDWRQLPALTDVIQAAGFRLQGIAVWDKTTGRARPRNGGFKQQAEFIVWACKGTLPQCDVYLPGVFQSRLQFPKRHMTEKPLEMAREIVRLVPAGGTVLDLFSGSGTFLVAAKEAGLNWAGCELNPAYYETSQERLAA